MSLKSYLGGNIKFFFEIPHKILGVSWLVILVGMGVQMPVYGHNRDSEIAVHKIADA